MPHPSCWKPGPAGGLRGLGLLLQAHVAQALALRRGVWAPSSAPSHPGLERGFVTVLAPHSLEQGCLELALVPWLNGVTTSRAAPNLAHTNTSHISAPTTPTAKRGPSRLGCSTVTLMAIFAFPALLGTVIMLERADMLLPAMPISQWPSHCSIPAQSPQGLGAIRGDSGNTGMIKTKKVHPFPKGESALLTGSCSNLQQGKLPAPSLDSHRHNQHPPARLCPPFLARGQAGAGCGQHSPGPHQGGDMRGWMSQNGERPAVPVPTSSAGLAQDGGARPTPPRKSNSLGEGRWQQEGAPRQGPPELCLPARLGWTMASGCTVMGTASSRHPAGHGARSPPPARWGGGAH